MISDWEVWACAQTMLDQHGDLAPLKIAERIGALAAAGDRQGIETWKRIASAAVVLSKRATSRHPDT